VRKVFFYPLANPIALGLSVHRELLAHHIEPYRYLKFVERSRLMSVAIYTNFWTVPGLSPHKIIDAINIYYDVQITPEVDLCVSFKWL